MTNKINSKYFLMALATVLVFGAITLLPADVNANYGYGSPFGTPIGNWYGYDKSYIPPVVQQPIYVTQPVYVQQPVIVQQPVVVKPVVVQQPVVYSPLAVSCGATVTYDNNYSRATVVWSANPSGGNGIYSYSWTGTDGLNSTYKNAYFNYSTPGPKYATVTVRSGVYSVTQNCSVVNVNFPYYQVYQPVVYQPAVQVANVITSRPSLDIGCYVDPTNAKVNQPINWTAEVTGGIGPYTYFWTGSDNLSGSQSSIIKYYSTPGSKSAIVTITSADGLTGVKACSNAITIASVTKAPVKVVKAPTSIKAPVVVEPAPTPITTSAASSILSLQDVPWGWVAILIILVLFFTVMYLLFNRKKI